MAVNRSALTRSIGPVSLCLDGLPNSLTHTIIACFFLEQVMGVAELLCQAVI